MNPAEPSCKKCGSTLPADTAATELETVRCGHCNALYAFAPEPGDAPASGAEIKTRFLVEIPNRFSVSTADGTLTITRRWSTSDSGTLFPMGIFANILLVVAIYNAIAKGDSAMLGFAFGLAPVSVGLSYIVLAGFINHTTVTASKKELKTAHAPLLWFGNKTIPREFVHQVYTKEVERNNHVSYNVEIVGDYHIRVPLVKGLSSSEQAVFVEQQIGRHLAIGDTPVRGELPR